MIILGIETSCDETAAAVVENGTKILSNVVASSQEIHAKYGGIIPDRAAREQLKSILPVINEAVSSQQLAVSDIDAIGVTVGPGLIGSLLVGMETAKSLALAWNKPLVPVNHLIGHVYANWLTNSSEFVVRSSERNDLLRTINYELPTFPAVVLIVSGGHTELVLMKGHGKFTWLGGTHDDAAGECFDKCARLLSLGYPGGPAIEAAASKFKMINEKFKIHLPRPLISENNFDFSFSGLKTAVANLSKSLTANRSPLAAPQIAYELQEAVSDVLVKKTLVAAKKYQAKSILLAGGVAANKRLREKLRSTMNHELPTMNLFIPPVNLCTDNAAYIASAAFFNYHPIPWGKITATPDLAIS